MLLEGLLGRPKNSTRLLVLLWKTESIKLCSQVDFIEMKSTEVSSSRLSPSTAEFYFFKMLQCYEYFRVDKVAWDLKLSEKEKGRKAARGTIPERSKNSLLTGQLENTWKEKILPQPQCCCPDMQRLGGQGAGRGKVVLVFFSAWRPSVIGYPVPLSSVILPATITVSPAV